MFNMIENIINYEKKISSQRGQDGIIEAIFNAIGTTNKFFVEFGIHQHEGNTLHLKNVMGWNGLWMDGGGDGETIKKEFITRDNINELLEKYNVPDSFDLLSIDIDGNDYYVWEVIKKNPRVLDIEYNSHISPNESKSIEYDPNFRWDGHDYYGASLLALVRLGVKKGYTLIGCDSTGTDSFFVRNDLIKDNFIVREVDELFRPPTFRGYHGQIGHPKSNRIMINI